MTSLRTQLWLWLLGLMIVAGLLAASFAYWSAQDEAKGFFDNQLRLMAIYMGDPVVAPSPPSADDADPPDPEDDFLLQVWDQTGRPLRSSLPGGPSGRKQNGLFRYGVYLSRMAHLYAGDGQSYGSGVAARDCAGGTCERCVLAIAYSGCCRYSAVLANRKS